ncbi:MAG: hypothetical protein KDJ67_15425, partial [Nitratireductor sp.]|nr:hypothetical protein [Nitratireductor sp.]
KPLARLMWDDWRDSSSEKRLAAKDCTALPLLDANFQLGEELPSSNPQKELGSWRCVVRKKAFGAQLATAETTLLRWSVVPQSPKFRGVNTPRHSRVQTAVHPGLQAFLSPRRQGRNSPCPVNQL